MVASGCLGLNPPTSETTLPTTVLNRMRQTKGLTRCRSLTGGQGLCERIEKLIDGVRGCTKLVEGLLKQVATSPPSQPPSNDLAPPFPVPNVRICRARGGPLDRQRELLCVRGIGRCIVDVGSRIAAIGLGPGSG